MTSLYVDRRDVLLKHDAGAIVFYENGQRSATVPLAPLTRLILRGKVTLARIFHACSQRRAQRGIAARI